MIIFINVYFIEQIINKFSLWIDKTSELLLKKETYEKVNSPNILKNLLDVLQIEVNFHIYFIIFRYVFIYIYITRIVITA